MKKVKTYKPLIILLVFAITQLYLGDLPRTYSAEASQSTGQELLLNPNFDTDSSNWYTYTQSGVSQIIVGRDTSDYESYPASYKIQCISTGTGSSYIQLYTVGLNIVKDRTYKLTFKAKAGCDFKIPSINLMKAGSPYTSYAPSFTNLAITTAWQTYSINFVSNTTDSNGRITFYLGGGIPNGAIFNIDSLSFKEAPPEPSQGELLSNPSFNTGTSGWYCYPDPNTASASISRDTQDYNSYPASCKLLCKTNGINFSSVQLYTTGLNIIKGKTYNLSFKAKASCDFKIPLIRLMKAGSPYTSYAFDATGIFVTTGWQNYSINFVANATDSNGRITIFLGAGILNGSIFNIDSLSFKDASVHSGTIENTSLC